MPVRLHHAPPQEGSEKPEAKEPPVPPAASPADAAPPLPAPLPQPEPIRGPAVALKPRIPLQTERRRARTLKAGAALVLLIGAGWAAKRALWPHTVRVPGALVLADQPVQAGVDGVVTASPAAGSKVDAGTILVEIGREQSDSPEVARVQAQLARA